MFPRTPRHDQAVSPVIAVILMVAITVVLAATTYVWVQGIGNDAPTTPGRASLRYTVQDYDGDAADDWISLTLSSSPNGDYGPSTVSLRLVAKNGTLTTPTACLNPQLTNSTCADPFDGSDKWTIGSSLYLPCPSQGVHRLSVALGSVTILDNAPLRCDESPG